MDVSKTTDVVIVGAGPAGSVCGYLLQKSGIDCVVVDRAFFPREKICAGGLTPKAWHLLDELMPNVKYNYNTVSRLHVDVDGEKNCEFAIAEPIRVVRRKAFDHKLLQEYQSIGGAFIHDTMTQIEEENHRIVVTLRSGMRIACRYLVGADGSNSRVRHYLKPNDDLGILIMEQYIEKGHDDTIDIKVSQKYKGAGYYFRFPNTDFNAVGFSDEHTTPDKFRQVLCEQGIDETTFHGAFVYISCDYPLHDHIILIGDAGGFANRTTFEGLYNAFATARNAAVSIIRNKPFREVNRRVFRKMKREVLVQKFFYSKTAFFIIKRMCRFPRLAAACMNLKLQHEGFL